MTEQEILKKALEKAIKNGYVALHIEEFGTGNFAEMMLGERYAIAGLLHSHFFAKAFWGEENWLMVTPHGKGCYDKFEGPRWKHELQQIVLEENPIKYLEKFL